MSKVVVVGTNGLAWAINRHDDVDALLATAPDQAAADDASRIRTVAVQGGPARANAGVANACGADVVMIGQGLRAGCSRRLARSLSRRGGCAVQVLGAMDACGRMSAILPRPLGERALLAG